MQGCSACHQGDEAAHQTTAAHPVMEAAIPPPKQEGDNPATCRPRPPLQPRSTPDPRLGCLAPPPSTPEHQPAPFPRTIPEYHPREPCASRHHLRRNAALPRSAKISGLSSCGGCCCTPPIPPIVSSIFCCCCCGGCCCCCCWTPPPAPPCWRAIICCWKPIWSCFIIICACCWFMAPDCTCWFNIIICCCICCWIICIIII
mmetsp:Transcript_45338/g.92612  ORF Transcript_45338/g.92612 Transcript_45338/m.92612 type:complete len:202 (-) Transcript_45338:21-626(-)